MKVKKRSRHGMEETRKAKPRRRSSLTGDAKELLSPRSREYINELGFRKWIPTMDQRALKGHRHQDHELSRSLKNYSDFYSEVTRRLYIQIKIHPLSLASAERSDFLPPSE